MRIVNDEYVFLPYKSPYGGESSTVIWEKGMGLSKSNQLIDPPGEVFTYEGSPKCFETLLACRIASRESQSSPCTSSITCTSVSPISAIFTSSSSIFTGRPTLVIYHFRPFSVEVNHT